MKKIIWKNDEGVMMTQYCLIIDQDVWLADVFMQPNGFIFVKSDYGDWSYRFCFSGGFEDFILSLSVGYFAGKVYQMWNYLSATRKMEQNAKNFAERVLPVLQEAIRESQCNDICAL